eukprot:EST49334.1 Hypothetical protein SS50377_10563 [Spironucleus salmonicida]
MVLLARMEVEILNVCMQSVKGIQELLAAYCSYYCLGTSILPSLFGSLETVSPNIPIKCTGSKNVQANLTHDGLKGRYCQGYALPSYHVSRPMGRAELVPGKPDMQFII